MHVAFLTSLVLLVGPNAETQNGRWREIGKTSVGNPVFIDPRSVKKGADGIITATVRATFVKPVVTSKGPITASRTVVMFDCAKKTTAVKENIYFHDEKTNSVYQRTAVADTLMPTTLGRMARMLVR